jgi:adenosylmethionine-8-amino-7-oxononanoate aminotransferase
MLNPNVSFVSPCNPYRGQHDDESDDAYVKRLADELEAEFQRVGPHRVIAFIAEPVVGAVSFPFSPVAGATENRSLAVGELQVTHDNIKTELVSRHLCHCKLPTIWRKYCTKRSQALGCVPALPGYLKAMQTVCHSHGALFIADEIMCGSGRCGTLHVWEKEEGFVPDIQTMGKALTGGYTPIGALLSSRRVTEVIEHDGAFAHGLTHQGSPTVCAVGLEVLRQILELLPNVRKMGALLSSKLKQALDHHPNVGNIRGDGLFWGVSCSR